MATIRSPGLGSNLDVNSIVEQLMAIERQPIQRLNNQESSYQVKISALGAIKSALGNFQTAAQKLIDPTKFEVMKAATTATAFTATALPTAAAASNNIEVELLARAQKLATTGFGATSTTVGTGTLEIEFGTYDETGNTFTPNTERAIRRVTIDAAHSSVSGIRDAINAANIGVTASIVNDGSGHRLVLSSNDTGAKNGMRVSVIDADGDHTDTAGLSRLAYDPTVTVGPGKNLSQTVSAQDARVVIDGITVNSAKNSITDAIEGITLNLTGTNSGSPAALTVSRDTAAVKSSINDFVKAYNDFATTLKQTSGYDAATKTATVLLGDAVPRSIEAQVRSTISSALADAGLTYRSLAQIGVAFTREGTLAVDSAKLDKALVGSSGADIAKLFAVRGTPSDAAITYSGATSKTKAGSYAVEVTQLATRGSATGTAVAGLQIDAGVNDDLSLEVDGIAATVTLSARTYTSAASLASELAAQLNASSVLSAAGVTVEVTESGGVLQVTSSRWGSASKVELTGGTARDGLFGVGATVDVTGVDAAGTIGGHVALGSGQKLTGQSGTAAEGLAITVAAGPLGNRGNVLLTRGVADKLDGLIGTLIGNKGPIASKTEGLNASIKRLDKTRIDTERKMELVEARIRAQFTALDTIVSKLTSTQNFLTQQIQSLPKFSDE